MIESCPVGPSAHATHMVPSDIRKALFFGMRRGAWLGAAEAGRTKISALPEFCSSAPAGIAIGAEGVDVRAIGSTSDPLDVNWAQARRQ